MAFRSWLRWLPAPMLDWIARRAGFAGLAGRPMAVPDPLAVRPTQGDGVTCPRCRIVSPTPIRGAARCSACGTVLR